MPKNKDCESNSATMSRQAVAAKTAQQHLKSEKPASRGHKHTCRDQERQPAGALKAPGAFATDPKKAQEDDAINKRGGHTDRQPKPL
jgi:hypothetical protein